MRLLRPYRGLLKAREGLSPASGRVGRCAVQLRQNGGGRGMQTPWSVLLPAEKSETPRSVSAEKSQTCDDGGAVR